MNKPTILTADGRMSIDRVLFDRILEALRFTYEAESQLDRARASERAGLLLLDLDAAGLLNVRCADICESAGAEHDPAPSGARAARFTAEWRPVLRPTDDIHFGAGLAHSVAPIGLHPDARPADIAAIAAVRSGWLHDLVASFLMHPTADADQLANLIYPVTGELGAILRHLREAIEPCSRSGTVAARGKEATR